MQLKLEPYQEEMRDFLITHERAAAFVSPGLGKTAATLFAIKYLMAEGVCKAALIVAPPVSYTHLTLPTILRV